MSETNPKFTVTIDGQSVQVDPGTTILNAARMIGDFRAPNLLRFGFSPLYLSFASIDRAVDALAEILTTRSWDDPRYTEKRRVT